MSVTVKIDKIIRSRRKTLGLEISGDASLIVRSPYGVSLNDIRKIIFEKKDWITSKQKIARERRLQTFPRKFSEREEFLYLGKSYPLIILETAANPLSFDKEFRLIRKHLSSAQRLFIDWYKKQAYLKIKERLDFYSELLGYKYSKFALSNAKRRWGSCNGEGNIHINWRLVMAPHHIIDYVVVHELFHLKEKNHSKKFWDKVKTIHGDYKRKRKWLKENGHLLIIEG
ncbi:M48 family metallopeptidase [bacterium]|nr:M48 family metallopeptidase [bacterium]